MATCVKPDGNMRERESLEEHTCTCKKVFASGYINTVHPFSISTKK